MSRSKGRTGARGRLVTVPAPTPQEVESAQDDARRAESHLSEIAAAHPSAKVWRVRLKAANAILARAK